jgi:hypothetical protein
MKKLVILLTSSSLLVSCASSCMTSSKPDTAKIDSVAVYRLEVESLRLENEELKSQLNWLRDDLRFKESEVSYWGHKYDSCMTILQKRKK